MNQDERNELVLDLLGYVTPLLRKYAAQYYRLFDFEDLYQEASIHIMRLVDAEMARVDSASFASVRFIAYNRVYSRIIDKVTSPHG